MEYVALARHSPESCPGSNAKVRKHVEQSMGKIEEMGKKHRVMLKSSHILMSSHLSILILEAPSVEAVEKFLTDGGFVQWNNTEIYPSVSMQDAMGGQGPPPIW